MHLMTMELMKTLIAVASYLKVIAVEKTNVYLSFFYIDSLKSNESTTTVPTSIDGVNEASKFEKNIWFFVLFCISF